MQICNLLGRGAAWLELSGGPAISEAVLKGDALADNDRRDLTPLPPNHGDCLVHHAAPDWSGVQNDAVGSAG